MSKTALRIQDLAIQTFEMGRDPMAAAALALGSDEQLTRVNGCTVLTTCSPGCDSTVEPAEPEKTIEPTI